jgi:anaerobic magnesium-protoporphyrin IX monomethyl ester cyclase
MFLLYKCSYCINDSYVKQYEELCDEPAGFKQYARMKSIDTVIKEINDVVSRFPQVKKIAFIDDNFLMYHNFVKDFYRRYKDEIGIPFMCNINPMSFDYEKGKFLKSAGCDDLRFGLESGSERIKNEIMKRPISNARVVEAFRITSELGIMSSSFNMIGLPTETQDEVLETLRLNASVLPDSIKIMTFYPFKNTPIYEMCEKLNMIDYNRKDELDDYDTFSCLKFSPEHQLFLEKVQAVFNWYINMFLDNQASSQYANLIEMIERMDKTEWDEYDFMAVDKKMSLQFREAGTLHYTKYMNRSLGAKFPSKHFGYNN